MYELLTSTTPFSEKRLRSVGYREMQRIILEEPPERPSTRLSTMAAEQRSTVAKKRGANELALGRAFASDLDWIAMKCLEKDRARRYETANGLGADLQRHLNNEPVLARPPSRLYEFQKTVRRHKLGFAAAATVIVTLAAGVLASSWQAVRAQRERQRVQRMVVRQYVANGTRLMNEGDLFGSLLWYTEALRLDAGDPQREEPHRMRVASVLAQCPKLLSVFSHGTILYHAEFSPDGNRVLTASDDHTVRVWDATTGRELHKLAHDSDVYHAAFSPDGLRIVSSCRDGKARVWDSQTGSLLQTLPHHGAVWRSCFSPDGHLVATGCEDKTVRVWSVETGRPIGEPLIHNAPVGRVGFSPDGRWLGATTQGGARMLACVWEVATGQQRFQGAHSGNFADVVFSPDSQRFLTCYGTELHVWDIQTLKEVLSPPLKLDGHITTTSFSPDGQSIIGVGCDFTARAWDAATGQPLFQPIKHAGWVNDGRISPDGRLLLSGGQDTVAQLWRTRAGQPFGPPLKHILQVKYLRFNPDGRRLLGTSGDQAARVWDLATSDLPGPSRPVIADERRLLSTNGHYALQLGESNVVWITDAQSARRMVALPHANEVVYTSFSRDGRCAITASQERNLVSDSPNEIFLWEVPTGRRLNAQPMEQQFTLLYAAFSPDNSRVLTCGFDYSARLWDTRTGQAIGPPLRHRQRVPWAAFSSDGKSAVTVSWDKTARVWDSATGNPLTPPLQHKAIVTGAFWSADGKRLQTVTDDDHLQVWDLATGEPLTPPREIEKPAGHALAYDRFASVRASEERPADDRPVADLVMLAQMLAVGRIDSGGNVVPLQTRDLSANWQYLHQKYPDQFATTPPEVYAWHSRQADESDVEGNVKAALFHIDRALEKRPQYPALVARRADLTSALANARPVHRTSAPRGILPREPNAGPDQIDLSPYYTLGLDEELPQWPGERLLAGFPRGLQTFNGVRFDMRGVVTLSSLQAKHDGYAFPEGVSGIRVGRKCLRLHFLQATAWPEANATRVGAYVLHYADGESRDLPVVYGRDLTDWMAKGVPTGALAPDGALRVWTGTNHFAEINQTSMGFYKSSRSNPRPEVELESIDFVSSLSSASPFLLALTVE